MSENKWTSEGPWVAYHCERSDEWSVRIKTHDHWGIYIEVADLGSDEFSQTKANAHLIAAAPELYEALELQEAAEDHYHNICGDCQGEGVPEACPTCFTIFDDARLARRAALAKARGEAQ